MIQQPANVDFAGARITGLHISLPSPEAKAKDMRVSLHWTDAELTVTIRLEGPPVTSFREVFDVGARLATAINAPGERPPEMGAEINGA